MIGDGRPISLKVKSDAGTVSIASGCEYRTDRYRIGDECLKARIS